MSSLHPSVAVVGNAAPSTARVTGHNVITIGSKPRLPLRRHTQKSRQDPRLIFILAHQTILRWEFAVRRLEPLGRSPTERAAVRMEVELGLCQLHTVSERLRPFSRSRKLAVRFESEEVMVRLNEVEARLVGVQREVTSRDRSFPLRTAKDIGEQLLAKARGLARP
jgi:hypothetical protein